MNPAVGGNQGAREARLAMLVEQIRREDPSITTEEEDKLRETAIQIAHILPRNAADAFIVLQAAYVLVKTFEAMGGL